MNVLDEVETERPSFPDRIQYRRLRAPQANGQTLQIPTFRDIDQTFTSNLATVLKLRNVPIAATTLGKLTDQARQEIIRIATARVQQYSDVKFESLVNKPIVMSGHQPKLFHPGVWYKNFSLSELGSRLDATPINLVVDNDICGVAAIQVPRFHDQQASLHSIPFDDVGDNLPFEARNIENMDVFKSFGSRVRAAIAPMVDRPIIVPLWNKAKDLTLPSMSMGDALARCRHALELDSGLRTLEVLLSEIASTAAFATFAWHLIEHREQFLKSYNEALLEYRRIHKIRSNSHPVPELETQDEWCEVPFWIWPTESAVRGRLFVRERSSGYELTNRRGLSVHLDSKSFADQFLDLSNQGVAIRPKALTNTMFCRLVLSDLFLHGIGGAKYDQLTDVIIEDFFGVAPPEYMTLTATMKLPAPVPLAYPNQVTDIKQTLRELRFHPETQLDNLDESSEPWVQQKHEWIKKVGSGSRLERHQAIESANLNLQPALEPKRVKLVERKQVLESQLRNSQILGSREFSFCLFPLELVDELKKMAS